MATKINFEKEWFLCRGFTNSPIDMHKSSPELSHLFEITSLDSCLTQNHNFYWKLEKMQTDQNMVAYYLRKWDFDSKDSKWNFKIDFQRDLLRKLFYFKIKEINLKTTKHKKWNTKQNRRKRIHKVKFFTTEQTKVVRIRANLHYFLMASEN